MHGVSVAADPHLDARATITEAAARLLAAGGCAPVIFRIFGDKNG